MSASEGAIFYIDGSSLGNPGAAGIGVVVTQGAVTIKNISRPIGDTTNNVAEYSALIAALEEARSMRLRRLQVRTDSQLLHRQITGVYRVKNEALRDLFLRVVRLMKEFEDVHIEHIPREENRGADKLARFASQQQQSKTEGVAARSAKHYGGREESPSSQGQRSG
jgi:ribonuclease HI